MERKYGFIQSPKDLRDYKINKIYRNIDLPIAFEVVHSDIKDQGMVNSCVAHSVAEVLETRDGNKYSTGWIYGYRPLNYYQGEGMVTLEALKTISNIGYLKYDDLDVKNGTQALVTYAMFDKMTKEEALFKYNSLLEYCKQDTWAMVEILRGLREAVKNEN